MYAAVSRAAFASGSGSVSTSSNMFTYGFGSDHHEYEYENDFDMTSTRLNENYHNVAADSDPLEIDIDSIFLVTGPQAPLLAASPKYSAAGFVDASNDLKTSAIQGLLSADYFSALVLCSLATFHEGISAISSDKKRKGVAVMKAEFAAHKCSFVCYQPEIEEYDPAPSQPR
jgi:hypothetical protein